MKTLAILSISFSFLFLNGCLQKSNSDMPQVSWQDHFDPNWATNALWDDGLAEVANYEAVRVIYGKERPHMLTHILVKEDFNTSFNVKTDDYNRNDLFTVMKFNQFARIETDNYPYHLQNSVFLYRDAFWLAHKLSISSQEWCGNTFKQWDRVGTQYSLLRHSYFDGQGDGKDFTASLALIEDQLFQSLRALRFEEGLQFRAPLILSAMGNTYKKPEVREATFKIKKEEFHNEEVWEVEMLLEDEIHASFIFQQEYPNLLLHFQAKDGRKALIKSQSRSAYWERVP
jgi:hypothetical protein